MQAGNEASLRMEVKWNCWMAMALLVVALNGCWYDHVSSYKILAKGFMETELEIFLYVKDGETHSSTLTELVDGINGTLDDLRSQTWTEAKGTEATVAIGGNPLEGKIKGKLEFEKAATPKSRIWLWNQQHKFQTTGAGTAIGSSSKQVGGKPETVLMHGEETSELYVLLLASVLYMPSNSWILAAEAHKHGANLLCELGKITLDAIKHNLQIGESKKTDVSKALYGLAVSSSSKVKASLVWDHRLESSGDAAVDQHPKIEPNNEAARDLQSQPTLSLSLDAYITRDHRIELPSYTLSPQDKEMDLHFSEKTVALTDALRATLCNVAGKAHDKMLKEPGQKVDEHTFEWKEEGKTILEDMLHSTTTRMQPLKREVAVHVVIEYKEKAVMEGIDGVLKDVMSFMIHHMMKPVDPLVETVEFTDGRVIQKDFIPEDITIKYPKSKEYPRLTLKIKITQEHFKSMDESHT